MKKQALSILLFGLVVIISSVAITQAQVVPAIDISNLWLRNGASVFPRNLSWDVGIGTSTPANKLSVAGNADVSGKLGIGTISPAGILHVQASGAVDTLHLTRQGSTWSLGPATGTGVASKFGIRDANLGATRLLIDGTGNVGIGTASPTEKLQVTGTIHSTSGGFKFPDGTVQTTAGGGGGGGIGGSGTPSIIPVFTASTTLGDSNIGVIGNEVVVGAFTPSKLSVGFLGVPVPFGTITAADLAFGPSAEGSIGVLSANLDGRTFMVAEGYDQFGNPYDAGLLGTCGTGTGGQSFCNGLSSPGSVNALVSFPVGYPDRGYIAVLDQSWPTALAGMYVDQFGQGIVFGTIKQFREPNPDDPATDIWYASVEGPEAAAYIRGTGHLVEGRAVLTFPDHFKAIASEEGMTVQLTPLSADSKGLAVVQKSLDGIQIQELDGGQSTYDFDYEVKAIRKGHEDYKVIRPRDEIVPAVSTRDTAGKRSLS